MGSHLATRNRKLLLDSRTDVFKLDFQEESINDILAAQKYSGNDPNFNDKDNSANFNSIQLLSSFQNHVGQAAPQLNNTFDAKPPQTVTRIAPRKLIIRADLSRISSIQTPCTLITEPLVFLKDQGKVACLARIPINHKGDLRLNDLGERSVHILTV